MSQRLATAPSILAGRPLNLVAQAQHQLTTGDYAAAESTARRQLKRNPADMAASYILGLALAKTGRLDAAAFYLRAPAQMPEAQRDCQCEYGQVLMDLGRHKEGLEFLRRATQTDPLSAYAWEHLARGLLRVGSFADAANAGEKAVSCEPTNTRAMTAIGTAWASMAVPEEAAAWYGRAVRTAPERIEAASAWAYFLNYIDASPADIATAHERCGVAARVSTVFNAELPAPRDVSTLPLRIGFLSPDLRDHPVARFLLPILRNVDRSRSSIYLYSLHPTRDAISRECAELADSWRDAGHLSLPALATTIAADQLDLLIDLAGWTGGTAAPVMSLRLARVQATYLGYPNITGINEINARLVDRTTDPAAREPFSSPRNEQLIALPNCFTCWEPPRNAPAVRARPANAPIVFGSFNYPGKLSARCLKTWSRVLASLPGSRLLIKGKGLTDDASRAVFTKVLARAGLDTSRIDIRGTVESYSDHLAAYADVDIALDPFPYNGVTTTCEALWMGVPVVALRGTTHAGRVGASLLRAAGMEARWVCASEDEYVLAATTSAANRANLAALRATLREQVAASSLCDGSGFTRAFEALVHTLAQSEGCQY